MQNISRSYVGVDVSKNSLDIYIYSTGKSFKIMNSESDIKTFIMTLRDYNVANIGCEATGGYEKLLVKLLKEKNYNPWVIDPRRVRGFIVASGCKSKTDKIDARKIAEFVSKNSPDYEIIHKTKNQERIQALVYRKKDLTTMLASEKTRLKHPTHEFCSSSIKKFIKLLEKEIKNLDQKINKLIESDAKLKEKSQILESIPGIGKATAALLLSAMPELGKLGNRKISALAGVCPYNNESGKFKGKQHIRGGRTDPRNALYMCALTTIKYNLILKRFYERLIERKKSFKVAIVAVMHKLIILANSLLKKSELCKV